MGLPGAAGPVGPAGPQGLPGLGLPPSAILLFTVCPPGWSAVGQQPAGINPLVACEQQGGAGGSSIGTISGETGYILSESSMTTPTFHMNQIDFGPTGYTEAQFSLLTPGAQHILGDFQSGSSAYSVAFSYEILCRVENAVLIKTGPEIIYNNPSGKITDLLISVGGIKLGVNVARAIAFPLGNPYTISQAQTLLTQKLQDIQLSTANVRAEDGWEKQILHIFTPDQQHLEVLQAAYALVDSMTKGNTIVYITRTDGVDEFMY